MWIALYWFSTPDHSRPDPSCTVTIIWAVYRIMHRSSACGTRTRTRGRRCAARLRSMSAPPRATFASPARLCTKNTCVQYSIYVFTRYTKAYVCPLSMHALTKYTCAESIHMRPLSQTPSAPLFPRLPVIFLNFKLDCSHAGFGKNENHAKRFFSEIPNNQMKKRNCSRLKSKACRAGKAWH